MYTKISMVLRRCPPQVGGLKVVCSTNTSEEHKRLFSCNAKELGLQMNYVAFLLFREIFHPKEAEIISVT